MHKKNKISRRNFIGTTGCAAMGSTAFLSSFTTLGMMNSLVVAPPLTTIKPWCVFYLQEETIPTT